jgi:hypothetical protein
MRKARRVGRRLPEIICLGLLLFLPMVEAVPFDGGSIVGPTVPGGANVGDGLFTLTPVQQVTASLAWDNFFCPHPWPDGCTNAVGVTYVPAGNVMVISEGRCTVYCNSTRNALVEYNATTNEYGPPLGLNCYPLIPFYPGVGNDYYVPCPNYAQNWSSMLVVDYQDNSVVANLSSPLSPGSMAYDSTDGMVYVGAALDGGAMEVFNPIANHLVGTLSVSGGTFTPGYYQWATAYTLVYDPATDHLIVPSTTNRFLVVDPTNGTVASSVSLPSSVETLAIDPASNQLFVATDNETTSVSGLSVFNARTYALEARLVVPNCIDYTCVGSNTINQILVDPSHGDAYLVGTLSLFTLNLSSLSLVGTTEDYGDGAPDSATYLPSLDQVISTYSIFQVGPGLLAQLHHGSVTVLSSFLWLPPALGISIAVQFSVGGLVAAWVLGRDRRRRPKESEVPRGRFGRVRGF